MIGRAKASPTLISCMRKMTVPVYVCVCVATSRPHAHHVVLSFSIHMHKTAGKDCHHWLHENSNGAHLLYSLKYFRSWKFLWISWVWAWPWKVSPAKVHIHTWCKVWLEAWPRKFYQQKFVFEQNLANHKISIPRKFRLYGVYSLYSS